MSKQNRETLAIPVHHHKTLVVDIPGGSIHRRERVSMPHPRTCICEHCLGHPLLCWCDRCREKIRLKRWGAQSESEPITVSAEMVRQEMDEKARFSRQEEESARRGKVHDLLANDLFQDEFAALLRRVQREAMDLAQLKQFGVNPGHEIDVGAIRLAQDLHKIGVAELRLQCQQAQRNMFLAILQKLDQEFPGHCLGNALRLGDALLLREE